MLMTDFATRQRVPGDRPLRRDVRLLNWQLRRLLHRHGAGDVWESLTSLRELAERRREGDPDAEARIAAALTTMPVQRMALMTRAMGLLFDLANLAEDRHRVRVLRNREAAGRQGETIRGAVAELRSAVHRPETLHALLRRLEVEPVFTAHPTEAKRTSIRRILRRLREDIYKVDRLPLLRSERRSRLDRMECNLLSLWLTDPISPSKPTVMEELHRTIYAVRTLWRIGPQIMFKLRAALDDPEERRTLDHPLRFGSWIGGDRDGNPFVTCDVTRTTLSRLRSTAIALHRRECIGVRRRLTVSALRCPLPEWFKARIEEARRRWPRLERYFEQIHPHEWIVQWLTIIDQRLRFSAELPDGGTHPMAYASADELAADLSLVRDALLAAGHDELTNGALARWQDRVQIFGLHLLRLDIRVNSTGVRAATDHLLRASGQIANYQQLDEAGRQAALATADPHRAAGIQVDLTEETADLVKVFTLAQRLAQTGAAEALGQLVVSMTHQPSDILSVVWLMKVAARAAGFEQPAPLPVVPLFETIDDLASAEGMLTALLDDAAFREYLRRGGDRITCMIGYSDSAKDGGYLASNWSLYDAQRRMAAYARQRGVVLTIFHGRGGAIGRGGGPAARAITSLPSEAVDGRLRLTEQGEVIAERYDDPAIALRHLEQLFWATLRQGMPHQNASPPGGEAFAQQLADVSRTAYRRLVEHPQFETYLRQCTALPFIEKLPIGSRPSRRTAAAKLEDLRAIPFTFAWNQVRMPINAFYGLGSAMDAMGEAGVRKGIELYRRWPWFQAVIDNAELALARCDTAIARRYALLAPNREESLAMWSHLSDEFDAAHRAVLAIKQESKIVEKIPWLDRTIRVRNPHLDMLNLIQIELMSRLRRGEMPAGESLEVEEAIRLTVQSIAAGLRNTG